ncbi:MAG: ribosome recycling factor [Candidatus Pacebacteria bacterium RIFOXYB1_FULL_39_46]|nr:MAG: ribosome recycling factor [Candidatus Pacebacteria bacterium RIFOXYA1_FULL_38_18]OGJ37931.1 MAG: ribosome recycling factor [Candidatus Pacebacteria bacterium RIFOXYB1_FULL_39_46]OGJ39529.1 MAG: ribosome recycling factor [Candidatus Pacebacteria bacterium RIFOXYC1_FULL_39_21]OGJ40110.1 MAG: ribosome recycling factor [Candidatus Pacebacteria bacterium RIFOXYD1_FULL_39_27]
MINKSDYLAQFEKVLKHVQQEVANLRTGRASIQMLDEVMVEAYGSRLHLNELASISVPDSSLLVVSPWDKGLIAEIEKGIQAANLNLSPVVDSDSIKVPVPSLTQERRQEMVKILHQKAENSRVMLRSVRAEIKQEIEDQEGGAGISEDDIKLSLSELEEVVKEYSTKIDELTKEKEKELTSF